MASMGFIPGFSEFDMDFETIEEEINEFSAKHKIWDEVVRLRKQVEVLENRVELMAQAKTEDKKPILVVHGIENMSDYESIHKIWQSYMPGGLVIGMDEKQGLETLNDRDLASVGLRRTHQTQPLTEADLYDEDIIRCSG